MNPPNPTLTTPASGSNQPVAYPDVSAQSPAQAETHPVFNVSSELGDINLFDSDPALQEAVQREGADWAIDDLKQFGALTGSCDYFWAVGTGLSVYRFCMTIVYANYAVFTFMLQSSKLSGRCVNHRAPDHHCGAIIRPGSWRSRLLDVLAAMLSHCSSVGGTAGQAGRPY